MTNLMLQGSDGRYYYLKPVTKELPSHRSFSWFADEQPMDDRTWLVADHQADEIIARWSEHRPVTGWKLADPSLASDKMPLEMTQDEFLALPSRLRDSGLYSAVYSEALQREIRIPAAEWTRYDGEPAPDDGLDWKAELPHAIASRRELHHLFPGYLDGFRAAAEAHIKNRAYVHFVYDRDRNGNFEITLQIPYDVPKSRWQPRILRNGGESRREGRNVPVLYRAEVKVHLPRAIAGPNRAAAVDEWNRRLAALEDLIAEASEVRACSHCDGQGVLSGKAVSV